VHRLAVLADVETDFFLIGRNAQRDEDVGHVVEHVRSDER